MVADIIRSLPPFAALFLISLFISVMVTIVYKFATNQKVMKALQSEMKLLRSKIKEIKDPSQVGSLNKQLMEKTMQQMTHSMKSTFITIIPIFLIFGWMSSNLAFGSVAPGEEFAASIEFDEGTTGNATLSSDNLEILDEATREISEDRVTWRLKGDEGRHNIMYSFGDETYTREVILTDEWDYVDPHLEKKRTFLGLINIGDENPVKPESEIKKISVDLPPVRPLGITLFGWKPGWLATYFFFMLALTFPIRRLLKVH